MQMQFNFQECSLVGEITIDYKLRTNPSVCIKSSSDAFDQMKTLFTRMDYKEELFILMLNRANHVLGYSKISEGGSSGTVVDIKIVFQHALLAHASSIIVAHNHPSGNLKPSEADIVTTRKMKEAGKLLDIQVFDHLIITRSGYHSLADSGQM